eukprot:gene18492-20341_t
MDITTEDNKLIWNDRVIIPTSLKEILLNDLHAEHLGIMKTKQLTRKYVWWPMIDQDVENKVKECVVYQETAKKPSETQQAKWSWPGGPWQRLHLDFAGPYEDHIVTDNGTQFTSNEFGTFLRSNNILHTKTAPAHPATNGLAERYVGHFKKKTTQMKISNEPLPVRLDKFLFTYRVTPTMIGKSPAELLMNRQPKTRFDFLRQKSLLDTKQQVKIFQDNSKFNTDFKLKQAVFVLNFGKGAKWLPGIILKEISPRSYEVQVEDIVWKRHCTQIRPRYIPTILIDRRKEEIHIPTEIPTTTEEEGKEVTTEESLESENESSINKDAVPELSIAPEPRYPRRERRKPDRLEIEH